MVENRPRQSAVRSSKGVVSSTPFPFFPSHRSHPNAQTQTWTRSTTSWDKREVSASRSTTWPVEEPRPRRRRTTWTRASTTSRRTSSSRAPRTTRRPSSRQRTRPLLPRSVARSRTALATTSPRAIKRKG